MCTVTEMKEKLFKALWYQRKSANVAVIEDGYFSLIAQREQAKVVAIECILVDLGLAAEYDDWNVKQYLEQEASNATREI